MTESLGDGAGRSQMRRRAQRWLFTWALVILVGGTAAGFFAAREERVDAQQRRAEFAAQRASDALETEIEDLVTSLGGAGAVVRPDATLDTEVFGRLASDVLSFGQVRGVGLLSIVTEDERAAFEASIGQELFVIRDDGTRARAPQATRHYPLVAVRTTADGPSPVGLDYAADEARHDAVLMALTTQSTAISRPISLAADGEQALLIVRPLLHQEAGSSQVVGFVITNLPIADLSRIAEESAGSAMQVAVTRDDELLAGEEIAPRDEIWSAQVVAADQQWMVSVSPQRSPDLTLAWLVAGGGTLATAAMATLWFVTSRLQRSLAERNAMLARNEEQSRAVQEVAGQLARALTSTEVATALVQHLPVAVGAHRVTLAVQGDNDRLEVFATASAERRSIDVHESLVDDVVSANEAAWLSSPLSWRNDAATTELAAGGNALALLPVRARQVRGVLAVSYDQVHIFSEQEQSLLRTVSLLTGRALSRGHRYEATRNAAVAFQEAALPDRLPEVDGLSICARYQPALQQSTVGGDWYDVLSLDEHRIALVVGDVVGHGIDAAATMGRLRTAFQVITSLHDDPGDMLRLMGEHVDLIPNAFCTTIVCAVLDLEDRTVTWSRAGHPPPLVIVDGCAETLTGKGSPPLGFQRDSVPPVHRRELGPGDTVMLFTDGVIERRGEDLDVGIERLMVTATSLADLEPEEFCDTLVQAMVPKDQQMDDLAVLVARFDPLSAETDDPPEAETRLAATDESSSLARRWLRSWLSGVQVGVGVEDDVARELEVVLSELVANAVVASRDGDIRVAARRTGDEVELEVENAPGGDQIVPGPWDLGDPLRGGGRGLVIVRAFVDSIDFHPGDERTGLTVRCRRSIAGARQTDALA